MPKTGALMKRWTPHATYRFKVRGQIEVVVCGLRAERQPPLILARHDAVKRVERRVAHEVTEGSRSCELAGNMNFHTVSIRLPTVSDFACNDCIVRN